MNTRTIRRAVTQDVPVLTQILNDARAYKREQADFAWGQWTQTGVQRWLNRSEMYLIEQEGISIATLSLSWQDEKYWGPQDPVAGYVHRLAVRSGFHGCGLGDVALNWSDHLVSAQNRHYLRLNCDHRNAKLCAYYEARGFVQVAIRPIPELSDYVASLYEKILR